ncbi:uncharacterized protein LOC132796827 isoform X1 [Drosophila nasuta]|uniref:uncharacterized protein LOC132796827 isoform X1 n=1 Tax=Drosophila nasuta TaxID=42062 RepID=UPI00295E782A|nr:uncharacterized protein LOC132796827 isoform X1 [Drosophila nasuta]
MKAIKQLLLGLIILFQLLQLGYGLECYACDSAEDAECATSPGQQLEVEECSVANDVCVTSITAGLTRRGCLRRLYPNAYCAEPCDRCSTSLCNRHVYPVDRLRCYQCSGADCIDVSQRPQLLLPCPVYNADDRCYTNVLHLSNTQRGCEHTNLPDGCPHVCLKCNYNGCNAELTVGESRCLQCTHNRLSPNPDCQRNQQPETEAEAEQKCALNNATVTQCVNKVMYGHRERCYTHLNTQTDVLQRGCSTTMGFFPTGELSECYGDNCNSQCQNIACATCNSTSDANCRGGNALSSKQCVDGTNACFSCEQDTLLRRGCADASFVPGGEGEACQLCRSGDNCNRWSVRTCYRCNSLESDEDCAQMLNPNAMSVSNCSHATELCVSTVISRLQMVHTVRGCAGEVPECTANDPYCVRCNGSLCNVAPTLWATQQEALQLQLQLRLATTPTRRQRQQQRQRSQWPMQLLDYLWPNLLSN